MNKHYSRAQFLLDAALLELDAKDVLTETMIKNRRGELMQMHHPDRGGDVTKAQDINAASDRLMHRIEKRNVRRQKIAAAMQAGAGLLVLVGSAGLIAAKKRIASRLK